MYFYKIRLDENKLKNISLADIHGLVSYDRSAERRKANRKLWRIDYIQGAPYLLVLCALEDNFGAVKDSLWDKSEMVQYLDYDAVLANICSEDNFFFRIAYNPVMPAKNDESGNRTRRIAYKKPDDIANRFTSVGRTKGFEVENMSIKDVVNYHIVRKDGSKVSFVSALIEGTLKVMDREKFVDVLCSGLGKEKAYGQGLLSIKKISQDALC